MSDIAPLSASLVGSGWQLATPPAGDALVTLHHVDASWCTIALSRCSAGPVRETYPVSAHDIELRLSDPPPPAHTLRALLVALWNAEPDCRRVVTAIPVHRADLKALAVEATFRHVVDVVTPGGEEVSLHVAEPEWVSDSDASAGHVPGT